MTFATTPQAKQKNWLERFTDQPHQLFFISAVLFSIFSMTMSIASFLGLEVNFNIYHGYGLIFAVFTNAFLGFLFTVIPKYTNAKPIKSSEYIAIWVFYQIVLVTLFLGMETIGLVGLSFVLLLAVASLFKTIKSGNALYKKESYILVSLLLSSSIILSIEVIFSITLMSVLFWGYLLGMVFVVALKMVPAFYSAYTQIKPWVKPKYIYEVSILILFSIGVSEQFELIMMKKIVSFIGLLFFLYIIFSLKIYKRTPAILYVLTSSFLWFAIGIIVYFIESFFELYTMKLSFHILAIGFILNLLIGFGSRVAMGHAVPSQRIEADKITIFLFLFTQVVVISRILSSVFYVYNYSFFMDLFLISSLLWIALFIVWSLRYGKTLLRV